MPLKRFGAMIGTPIDGILGYDVLRPFVLAVDAARRQVRFLGRVTDAALRLPGAVPWRMVGGRPFLNLQLVRADGKTVSGKALIDTGSSSAETAGAGLAERLGIVPRKGGLVRRQGGVGGMNASIVADLGQIRVGHVELNQPEGLILAEAAGASRESLAVGLGFPRPLPFALDFPGGKLILSSAYPAGILGPLSVLAPLLR